MANGIGMFEELTIIMTLENLAIPIHARSTYLLRPRAL